MANLMESKWRIKIKSKDKKELVKFVFNEHLDISCGGPVQLEDGTFEIDAYVREEKKKALLNVSSRSNSMKMEIVEDMTENGIERQKEVLKENKFKDLRSANLSGFGIKE